MTPNRPISSQIWWHPFFWISKTTSLSLIIFFFIFIWWFRCSTNTKQILKETSNSSWWWLFSFLYSLNPFFKSLRKFNSLIICLHVSNPLKSYLFLLFFSLNFFLYFDFSSSQTNFGNSSLIHNLFNLFSFFLSFFSFWNNCPI